MLGIPHPPWPADLPGRFACLFAGLCAMVAAHIAKDRNAVPWIVAVWTRMNALRQRIARLSAQIEAGTVPPLRAGFTLTKPRKKPTRPPLILPRNPMWLVQVIQPTAVYGVWLQQFLADPRMPAMLAAAPQLARILRPLCRALGVTPPPLPPRPQRPTRPAAPDSVPPDAAPPSRAGPGCETDQGRAASTGSAIPLSPDPLPPPQRAARPRRPIQEPLPGRRRSRALTPPGLTQKPA